MKQLFCFLILLFCMSFSYEALAQEERATPKSGEGISGFLQRNGRTGKAYYQEMCIRDRAYSIPFVSGRLAPFPYS